MKNTIKINLVFLLLITLTSFTNNEYKGQSNNFPQIQSYLDKTNGKDISNGNDKEISISQVITENSFSHSYKNKTLGLVSRLEETGVNWNDYNKMETTYLKNEKYYRVTLEFKTKFESSHFIDDEQVGNSESWYLHCYILQKDCLAFIGVMEEWKKSRY